MLHNIYFFSPKGLGIDHHCISYAKKKFLDFQVEENPACKELKTYQFFLSFFFKLGGTWTSSSSHNY